MATPRSIHEFDAVSAFNSLAKLLLDNPDLGSESGYITQSITILEMAIAILDDIAYTQDLNTDNKTVFGAINEIRNVAFNVYPTDELSGNIATFESPAELPLISCIANITAIQSGTGDPSPDNVRPISGFDGLELSHSGADTSNPDVIAIDWSEEADTVYGGTLDVVSGVLTLTHNAVDLSTLAWSYSGSGTSARWYSYSLSSLIEKPTSGTQILDMIMEKYKAINYNATLANYPDHIAVLSDGRLITLKYDDNSPSGLCVYPLATPIEIQLTPEEITALVGTNNIWADTGDISVTAKVTVEDYINRRLGNNNRSLSMSAPNISLTKSDLTDSDADIKEIKTELTDDTDIKETKGDNEDANTEKK